MNSRKHEWHTGAPTIDAPLAGRDSAQRASVSTPAVASEPADRSARVVRDPLIGRLLHDRYRVERRIGKGGMGVVYLAEHVLIRRKVAIKVLHAPAFASEESVQRFQREAMAAAAVGSEHVVAVTDMGELESGSHYLVLEYLDGRELAAAVAEAGRLPLARTLEIASQLCDALTAVHAAGIVHRDLKPENVFLIERAGRDFVKVLDFGICKVREAGASGEHKLTATGVAIGTPQFMAPEQIEGRSDVDHRADIYGVGAILFFALTGVEPFEASSLPQLFRRICENEAPHLRSLRPELPEALSAVVARALEKQPDQRYQSSAELKAALAPFAQSDGTPSFAPAPITGVAPARESGVLAVPGRRTGPRRIALALATLSALAALWQIFSSVGSPHVSRATEPTATRDELRKANAGPRLAREPGGASAAGPRPVPAEVNAAEATVFAAPSTPPQARASTTRGRTGSGAGERSHAGEAHSSLRNAVAGDSLEPANAASGSATPASAAPPPTSEASGSALQPASNPPAAQIEAEPWPEPRKLKHVF